jgi:hypothetical protein
MRGGAKTRNDAIRQDPTQHQCVKNNTEPHKKFDVHNEKEIFKQARQEFLEPNIASTSTAHHTQEVPTYEIPPSLDHTKEAQPLGQVSMIKGFFQSCVRLLNNPSSVKVLQNILERCSAEV